MIKSLIERTKRSWRISKTHRHSFASTLQLYLSSESSDVIEREVARFSPHLETGGILIGHVDRAGSIRVTHASGPGPKAVHQPSYFLRDTKYCAAILSECYEKSGADYVGEWHSHVGRLNHPSSGDLHTLVRIMRDPDYDFNVFAMVIAVGPGRIRSRHIKLNGFIATRNFLRRVSIKSG